MSPWKKRVGTQKGGRGLPEDTGEGFGEKTLQLVLKDMQTFAKWIREHFQWQEPWAYYIEKKLDYLKWFLNWSIRKGYCKEKYINKYSPSFRNIKIS